MVQVEFSQDQYIFSENAVQPQIALSINNPIAIDLTVDVLGGKLYTQLTLMLLNKFVL